MGLALITGASAGLGTEFAKLFVQEGHDVILVARRRDKLEEVARALGFVNSRVKAHVIELDLGKPGAGTALFERVQNIGAVDFLVNNAGFGNSGPFAGNALARELELLDLNVRTLVELTHLVLPGMLARKCGKILNVGSTAGFQAGPFMANYYASKAYVNSFSEALAVELRGSGVTCTVLAPGATRTEFFGTAGIENSKLASTGAATAASVARVGFEAMKKGRAMKVAGLKNFILVQAVRLTPRGIAARVAAFLNR